MNCHSKTALKIARTSSGVLNLLRVFVLEGEPRIMLTAPRNVFVVLLLATVLVVGCMPQATIEPVASPTSVLPTSTPTLEPTPTPTLVPTYTPLPALEPVELAELEGSVGPVYSLAWSPDGSTLASAGYGQVKLWDAETNEELRTLEGHTSFVWGVAWSPDGSVLASTGQDGTVRLWDSETYEELAEFRVGWGFCVAWSPDGGRLAVGNGSGAVVVWDVETGALTYSSSQGRSPIIGIAWSPDGGTIAAGDLSGKIGLWDAETGEQLNVLQGYTNQRCDANGIAWSPDGQILASAHQDGPIRLWSADGELLQTLEGHAGWARGVAWSPDGRLLASTGESHRVCVWDAETGQRIAKPRAGSMAVWSVTWSPDGSRFAAGSGVYDSADSDGTIVVWAMSSVED